VDQEKSLDELGRLYQTDKSSLQHNYLAFYQEYFRPLRDKSLVILEIGVFNGASLKTWQDYFPRAKVIGADIEPGAKRYENDRIFIEIIDQSNIEDLTRLAVRYGPFDIIVEDGSHLWEHQITSLKTLFPFLRAGGYYIVEDLQTNYGALAKNYSGNATISCIEYIKKWIDLRVGDDQIDISSIDDPFLRTYGRAARHLTLYRRACLIQKAHEERIPLGVDPGLPVISHPGDHSSSTKVGVLAHLSYRGDVWGGNGWVRGRAEQQTIQGVELHSRERVLQYRVRWDNGEQSQWTDEGNFIGSRGKSRPLTGIAVQLIPGAAARYELLVCCLFVGNSDTVSSAAGDFCSSPSGAALLGLQVVLKVRR
jgi:cephalosporin hydroxylase